MNRRKFLRLLAGAVPVVAAAKVACGSGLVDYEIAIDSVPGAPLETFTWAEDPDCPRGMVFYLDVRTKSYWVFRPDENGGEL